MTTSTVTFSDDEVDLLYSVPQPGGDLSTIIRTFVFLNRSAAPPFSILRNCFTKALQSGILLASDGHYQITPVWYGRIHKYDESEVNEIASLLAFEDEFVGEEVPVVVAAQLAFTEKDYEAVLESMQ